MKYTSALLAILPLVAGHGSIITPKSRGVGPAMKAACGEQVYNNQAADKDGNSQGETQIAKNQKDYQPDKCNLFLCKGYQFEDNKDNVQSWSPGQKINLKIDIHAPHTGTMNVSIVDTKSNSIIGTPLISSQDYASNSRPIGASDTDLEVTLPMDFKGKCAVAGECVMQWWWDARSVDQTYESCADFTVGGGSAASAPTAPAKAITSPAVPETYEDTSSADDVAASGGKNQDSSAATPASSPASAAPLVPAEASDDGDTASGTTSPAPGYGESNSINPSGAPSASGQPTSKVQQATTYKDSSRFQPRPNGAQFTQLKSFFEGVFGRFFGQQQHHKRQE